MSKKKPDRTQRRINKNARKNKQLKRIQDVIQGKEVSGAEPSWLPEIWSLFGAAYTQAIVDKEKNKIAQKEISIKNENTELMTPVNLESN